MIEEGIIKILKDFETFKMQENEIGVYAHTDSYLPFIDRIKSVTKNIILNDAGNQRAFLISFMDHYRDNEGMAKRDIEAIDDFLKKIKWQ